MSGFIQDSFFGILFENSGICFHSLMIVVKLDQPLFIINPWQNQIFERTTLSIGLTVKDLANFMLIVNYVQVQFSLSVIEELSAKTA